MLEYLLVALLVAAYYLSAHISIGALLGADPYLASKTRADFAPAMVLGPLCLLYYVAAYRLHAQDRQNPFYAEIREGLRQLDTLRGRTGDGVRERRDQLISAVVDLRKYPQRLRDAAALDADGSEFQRLQALAQAAKTTDG